MKPTIRIDHIALYVQELEQARDFFIRYFGATSNDMYHNPRTGLRTYFLRFGDTGRLEIMTRPGLSAAEGKDLRTGYAHLAFSVGNREQVDKLTARLKADGYAVTSGPRVTGDGCYESCVEGPEVCLIEITE